MARKYDIEDVLTDMKSVCTTNLATKLLEIDAEKADRALLPVNANAYFFQSLEHAKAAAFPVFIYYWMEDPTADGLGPNTLQDLEISFVVVLKDTAENDFYLTRMLRYSRALKEIFEQSCTGNMKHLRMLISSLSPVTFMIEGADTSFHAAGIKLRVKL